MGLSAGGIIQGRGLYMQVKKKASETTDIIRQNENLDLKNVSFLYLLIKENLHFPNFLIILFWLKNRNQRVHTGVLMGVE